jgi:hypothetical protein
MLILVFLSAYKDSGSISAPNIGLVLWQKKNDVMSNVQADDFTKYRKNVMYCAHNLFVDMPRRFYNAFLFLCIYGKIKLSLLEHVK